MATNEVVCHLIDLPRVGDIAGKVARNFGVTLISHGVFHQWHHDNFELGWELVLELFAREDRRLYGVVKNHCRTIYKLYYRIDCFCFRIRYFSAGGTMRIT